MSASICRAVLGQCLRGEPWSREMLGCLECPELFSVLAEGLSDRFERRLVERYVEIFSEGVAAVRPDLNASGLRARYERVRRPRPFTGPDPEAVVVLSRVTLGADVAITSVILDAVKRRFPRARIRFAGSRKSYELFAADARIEHLPVAYGRTVRERFSPPWFDAVVIDPDSRISQLGLIPVAPEESYYLFESRGEGDGSLSELARRWTAGTFGVEGAPYIAVSEKPAVEGAIAVSLGVGENPAKRVADPFEARLLGHLDPPVVIDSGGGEEEAERVRRAAPAGATILRGSFAQFAATIAASRLYVGYDSAGQHVAAAAGVPLVSVFAGVPSERFFERWRPTGTGRIEIVRAGDGSEFERTAAAVRRLLA